MVIIILGVEVFVHPDRQEPLTDRARSRRIHTLHQKMKIFEKKIQLEFE